MKAKRLLTMLPIAAAMLLAACAPQADGGDSRTKVTFWHTFSYSSEIDNIIKKFEKLNPDIHVVAEKKQGSYTDLKDMTIKGVPANNYPDLVVAYPDHVAEYLELDVAVELNQYMDDPTDGWTAEEKADIVPSFLEEGAQYPIKGTYSLPLAKSTEGMFYNEQLIGVDLKAIDASINGGKALSHEYLNNLTWEELFGKLAPALVKYNKALPDAEKLYLEDQDFHGIFGWDSDDNLFITLAKQYGYGYTALNEVGEGQLLFNNPEMKSLMKTFRQAAKDGYIVTKGMANGKHPNDFFKVKNCLFSVGSTGGVKYQKSDLFNVSVARIPHAEGKDPYVINQGPSVAVLSHQSKARELATWKFYKFMTNQENSLYWSLQTGYMPIRQSNYEHEDFIAYANDEGKAPMSIERLTAKNAQYVGTVSNDLFTSAVFKGSSEAREQVSAIMTRCLKDVKLELTDKDIDDIFQKAIDETRLAM